MTNVTRMGLPTPTVGPAPAVGPAPTVGASAKTTLIEDDTEFKGTLSSKCPVVVKGAVEGEVNGPSLHVSPSGSVSGKVKVGELRSEGTLAGEFDADTVQLAGTVKNDTVIRARSLEVRLAPASGRMQITFGQCELAVGDVPAKEDAVAVASGRPVEAPTRDTSEELPTTVREADRVATEAETTAGGPRGKPRRDSSNPAAP
ncbi:MAG TPA: polymer-forming cytoskeletal protein [Kofleriaceae bacterium]|nr:polymer-forming cytoskeletal protein [Kofleriaceae bacterium]